MHHPTLKTFVSGIVLALVSISHSPTWAAPSVGLIDFNANGGDFTVVSTNNPGGPWTHDSVRGSWSCFDTNDCGAVAFRSSRLNSPILTVPAAGSVALSFNHRFSFEADTTRWDGGQLRISVNQGPYVAVPLANFTANGYNDTIGGAAVPNCELAGQFAFTAQSVDYQFASYITSVATLGTFNQNDTISIQFLGAWDDCVQGLVPNWEIDSVTFSPPLEDRRTPPTFSDGALPADAAVPERQSHTLRSAAVGHVSLQWFKNSVAIPGANGSSHTIARMTGADVGQYFVRAINSIGNTDSRIANISMIPDITPPTFVWARCGANPNDVLVRLSEPLALDNGVGGSPGEVFLWNIEKVSGPGADPGLPASVNYTNGETTIYMTITPGIMDYSLNTYRVVLLDYMVDTAAAANRLPAGSSVPLTCPRAIPVDANGAGPFTFDTIPLQREFTTFTWAGGANGVNDTVATVEARVQLMDASAINVPLMAAAGTPPAAAGVGQWASAGRNLITRPTGVSGCVLMARLQNDTGSTRTTLDISYDLLVQFPVVEEVPGHLVYYSVSGVPGSWRRLLGISGDRTTGFKTATLDLTATPWPVGSLLFILWADDNGSGSPDDANQIDNFAVSLGRPSLRITYSNPNVTVTWPPGSGILQSKSSLTDLLWTDVPGAGSSGSATVAASGSHRFFTLRAP